MSGRAKGRKPSPEKRAASKGARFAKQPRAASPPPNLVSLVRGLYYRVSKILKVHPSYVSRVARGQRRSEAVEREIRGQLRKIVALFESRTGKRSRVSRRPKRG